MSDALSIGVGARARGLSAHLLTRAEVEALAGSPDEAALGRALAATGKLAVAPTERGGAAELEVRVQQTVGRHLATLGRWAGQRGALAVFEAHADLRSLRALVRGAVEGSPAARRLSGLVPTRLLPLKLLETLARQPTAAGVAAHLFATRHPDGARLSALTRARSAPQLLELDHALVQGFAERAAAAAKGTDEVLAAFVGDRLDAANVAAALALAGRHEAHAERWYVPGGAHVEKDAFVAAAAAVDTAGAVAVLGRALAGSPLRRALAPTVTAAQVERAAFRASLAAARRAARLEPLASGPTLYFLLRLEAMARDVRRVAHGLALGVPRTLILPELVTP